MGSVTLKLEPASAVGRPTGHVASLRMPISLGSMKAMSDFFTRAYGPNCVMHEEPEGWLKIEVPNDDAAEQERMRGGGTPR